jgi:hypothetical protein
MPRGRLQWSADFSWRDRIWMWCKGREFDSFFLLPGCRRRIRPVRRFRATDLPPTVTTYLRVSCTAHMRHFQQFPAGWKMRGETNGLIFLFIFLKGQNDYVNPCKVRQDPLNPLFRKSSFRKEVYISIFAFQCRHLADQPFPSELFEIVPRKDWTSCDDPWRCYIQLAGQQGGPPESAGHGWEPGLAFDCDYATLNKVSSGYISNLIDQNHFLMLYCSCRPLRMSLHRAVQHRLVCASKIKLDSHRTAPKIGLANGLLLRWHNERPCR